MLHLKLYTVILVVLSFVGCTRCVGGFGGKGTPGPTLGSGSSSGSSPVPTPAPTAGPTPAPTPAPTLSYSSSVRSSVRLDLLCDKNADGNGHTEGSGYLHVGGVRKSAVACEHIAAYIGKTVKCEMQTQANQDKYYISFENDANCEKTISELKEKSSLSSIDFECKSPWGKTLLHVNADCGAALSAMTAALLDMTPTLAPTLAPPPAPTPGSGFGSSPGSSPALSTQTSTTTDEPAPSGPFSDWICTEEGQLAIPYHYSDAQCQSILEKDYETAHSYKAVVKSLKCINYQDPLHGNGAGIWRVNMLAPQQKNCEGVASEMVQMLESVNNDDDPKVGFVCKITPSPAGTPASTLSVLGLTMANYATNPDTGSPVFQSGTLVLSTSPQIACNGILSKLISVFTTKPDAPTTTAETTTDAPPTTSAADAAEAAPNSKAAIIATNLLKEALDVVKTNVTSTVQILRAVGIALQSAPAGTWTASAVLSNLTMLLDVVDKLAFLAKTQDADDNDDDDDAENTNSPRKRRDIVSTIENVMSELARCLPDGTAVGQQGEEVDVLLSSVPTNRAFEINQSYFLNVIADGGQSDTAALFAATTTKAAEKGTTQVFVDDVTGIKVGHTMSFRNSFKEIAVVKSVSHKCNRLEEIMEDDNSVFKGLCSDDADCSWDSTEKKCCLASYADADGNCLYGSNVDWKKGHVILETPLIYKHDSNVNAYFGPAVLGFDGVSFTLPPFTSLDTLSSKESSPQYVGLAAMLFRNATSIFQGKLEQHDGVEEAAVIVVEDAGTNYREQGQILSSAVLSVKYGTGNPTGTKFTGNNTITFTLPLLPSDSNLSQEDGGGGGGGSSSSSSSRACMFFVPSDPAYRTTEYAGFVGGSFTDVGCTQKLAGAKVAPLNQSQSMLPLPTITCECNHLTSFAVLLDTSSNMMQASAQVAAALSTVSRVGAIISSVFLAMTICIYAVYNRALTKSKKVLIGLASSLLVSMIMFVVGQQFVDQKGVLASGQGCVASGAVLHFSLLASFCWMLCEGFQLYLEFVVVLGYRDHFVKMCGFATAVPAIVVAATVGSNSAHYTDRNGLCWIQDGPAFNAAFVGPVFTVMGTNLIIFVMVLRNILNMNSDDELKTKAKRGMMVSVTFFVLMGIGWFPVLLLHVESEKMQTAVHFLFAIVNAFSGLWLFILHVWRDTLLREEIAKGWGKSTSKKSSLALGSKSSSASTQPKQRFRISSWFFSSNSEPRGSIVNGDSPAAAGTVLPSASLAAEATNINGSTSDGYLLVGIDDNDGLEAGDGDLEGVSTAHEFNAGTTDVAYFPAANDSNAMESDIVEIVLEDFC